MEYRIHKDVLEHNMNNLMQYGEIYYPLKTNSSKEVLRCLLGIKQDLRFLINSTSQLNKLEELNIEKRRITQISTLMKVEDLNSLYARGIKSFVFDNAEKLKQFIVGKNDLEITLKVAVVGIQVNTGADEIELDKLRDIVNEHKIRHGYSIYINKQARELLGYAEHIRRLLSVSEGDTFLSLGGLHRINSIELLGILYNLKQLTKELRIEPGEILVSKAVDCEAEILNINHSNNVASITIEGSLYDKYYDLIGLGRKFKISRIGKQVVENKGLPVHIFGDSGDSNDYMGCVYIKDTSHLKVGDKVELKDVGYYFGRQ